jgi:hypothetical protein
MALGATPRQVLSMVMAESGRLLGAGLLLGWPVRFYWRDF